MQGVNKSKYITIITSREPYINLLYNKYVFYFNIGKCESTILIYEYIK